MPPKTGKPTAAHCHLMVVTCTPLETGVEFFEHEDEAREAARANVVPGTTTYLGEVKRQGHETTFPDDHHIAVMATLTPADLVKLRRLVNPTARGRKGLAQVLTRLLADAVRAL